MARKQKRGPSKYRIEVFTGRDERGRQMFYSETFEGSEKQADDRATYLQVCADQGMNLREMKLGKLTSMNQLIDDWLALVKKPRVSRRTYEDYARFANLYWRPQLGKLAVKDVTTLVLQRHMQKLSIRLGSRQLAASRNYLSSLFREAVTWNLVKENPVIGLAAPRVKKRKYKVLDAAQMQKLIDTCRSDPQGLPFLTMILTAIRPGELIALQWQDCELGDEPAIRIERAYVDLAGCKDLPSGMRWQFGPPKTESGKRTIPIPIWLRDLLIEHREYQDFSGRPNPYGLIFPAAGKGNPIQPNNLRTQNFAPILKQAGLEYMRIYDLRHSAATWLVQRSHDAEAVSKMIGHASVQFTLDTYVHSDSRRHREVMNTWEQFNEPPAKDVEANELIN